MKKIFKENADNHGQHDHEASMAKAELYKAAEYAIKIFHMIQPGDNLEGWVAAKITKAADYLDSVGHYMEYHKKFEPEQEVDSNEQDLDFNESTKKEVENQLLEQWKNYKTQG
jgi:hypothetical protein